MFNIQRNFINKKIIKKIFILIIFPLILSGCKNLKDTLSLKKKQNVDEFLIEKKNPLSVPPEFNKLPVPSPDMNDQKAATNENLDLNKVFDQSKKESDKSKDVSTSDSLEKSISNILNKK
jgi:hypothetical protein